MQSFKSEEKKLCFRISKSIQKVDVKPFRVLLVSVSMLVSSIITPETMAASQTNQQQQAVQLCSVAVGVFVTGQFNYQQALTGQALQIAQSQTSGQGVYQQLRPYGNGSQYFISNPHFDQDQQYGQLFHFYCTSQHQSGLIQWELKFAPSQNKIAYYALQLGQTQQPTPGVPTPPASPGIPTPQMPAQPQNPTPFPQPQVPSVNEPGGPQPAPGRDAACQAFPGMC